MGDRCEKCEQVAAELRAELRAEFDQLREDFVRRIEEILAKSSNLVADVEAKNSVLTDIGTGYRGLLADVDRRVQRLFDALDRLQFPLQRRNEEPRLH